MTHRVQHVAITFEDGGVAIMQFVLNPRIPGMGRIEREASPEAIQAEIAKSAWGERKPLKWRLMDPAEIPAHREYRNAWKDDGKAIVHDMPKARALHRDKLREARTPLLAALDVAYHRADEAGEDIKKRDVAAQKQRLRDITTDPRIDAAQHVDELRAVTVA